MKTAVEWLLNQKSIDPTDRVEWLIKHRQETETPKPHSLIKSTFGPASYDTANNHDTAYQDGSLHIRKGWAKR